MEEMLMGTTNQQQVQGSNPNLIPPPPSSSPAPGAGGGAIGLVAGAVVAGVGSSERKARPQKEKALNCPRCNSTNTKFCYYNNYSLQQPRYFCKTCRRYWTEGGSLRNVPVGGGSRKNKRSSSSSSANAASGVSASTSIMASSTSMASKNPKLAHHHEGGGAQHDLNLSFAHHGLHGGMQQQAADQYMAFPSLESSSIGGAMASGNNGRHGPGAGPLSAMELLRSTGCYMPSLHVPMQMPPAAPGEYGAAAVQGFSLGEFRAAPGPAQSQSSQSLLGFSLDAHHGGTVGMQGMPQDRAGRMLFPFEDLKPTDASGAGSGAGVENGGRHQYEQAGKEQGDGGTGSHAGHDTAPGFWNGMIGGGTSW